MRRLLQCGTLLFLLVILLAPLSELFDRWDAPGLTDDAEFSAFALAFALCLVLILMHLLSSAALRINFASLPGPAQPQSHPPASPLHHHILLIAVSPPPLRI